MSRRPFGWDLPPGVTHRMIEEQFGDDGPCECCGHDVTDCICPECQVCGQTGNVTCYVSHGMTRNNQQLIGLCENDIRTMRLRIQEEEEHIAFLKSGGDLE